MMKNTKLSLMSVNELLNVLILERKYAREYNLRCMNHSINMNISMIALFRLFTELLQKFQNDKCFVLSLLIMF